MRPLALATTLSAVVAVLALAGAMHDNAAANDRVAAALERMAPSDPMLVCNDDGCDYEDHAHDLEPSVVGMGGPRVRDDAFVGPGFIDGWTVSCDTTPSDNPLVPATVTYSVLAFECQAPEPGETGATTFVAIGPSDVADPAFATRDSKVICGSGCNFASAPVNARQGYCRADTGTVSLFCWAIVAAPSAP